MLTLVLPDRRHEQDVWALRAAFQAQGEHIHGGCGLAGFTSYRHWLRHTRRQQQASGVRAPDVPSLTFLAYDADRLVGLLNLRLRLTPALRQKGGHIGYSVHPDRRRQGYATRMLRQALSLLAGLGIERVLVTASPDNKASCRVIEKNGGQLEPRPGQDGFLRFWIDTCVR